MGYEKFVKKIFPFIGNQYDDVTIEEGSSSSSIVATYTVGMARNLIHQKELTPDVEYCYSLVHETGVFELKSQEDESIANRLCCMQTNANNGMILFPNFITGELKAFIGEEDDKEITTLNGTSPYVGYNIQTEEPTTITQEEMGMKNLIAHLYLNVCDSRDWFNDESVKDDDPIFILAYECSDVQVEQPIEEVE